MPSLLSPRRADPELVLHATVAVDDHLHRAGSESEPPRLGWWLAGVGGALTAALCGWVLVVGVAVIGWLAAGSGSFLGAVGVGTQLWLLGNGAGARLGDTSLTLAPWGLTLVLAALVARVGAFATSQARGRPGQVVARVSGVLALTYAGCVLVTATALNGLEHALRALVAPLVIALLAAAWGSCRAIRYDPTSGWPRWARALSRGVLGGQAVMLTAGAAALTAALLVHLQRVQALTDSLQPGVVGGIALLLVQLAVVPNAVVWSGAYTLGAGFSLGQGSVVAPAASSWGLLPAVPLLGALPGPGPGESSELWWLLAGAAAGAVAAWLTLRGRPPERLDVSCLLGAAAGLLSGVVFTAVGWASGGDLGVARLSGAGPRLLPLLVLAGATMGLAGMFVGLVVGLLRRPPRLVRSADSGSADQEETAVLRGRGSARTPRAATDPTAAG